MLLYEGKAQFVTEMDNARQQKDTPTTVWIPTICLLKPTGATLVEAEKFVHTITLHFGLLSYDCEDEQQFIEAVEQLLRGYKEAEAWELVIKKHFEF